MQNKEYISEGNYGWAYKVVRKYDGLQVVAKVLKTSVYAIDEEGSDIFERELKVLKQADHPFLIEFIENFVYQKQFLCIITKYVSGGDLRALIYEKKRQKCISENEALIYLA
jgi:serine/threonine protein kinase